MYRESVALSRVSLPRLVDLDWFVHVQKASSEVPQLNVPTVQLQLNLQPQATSTHTLPHTEAVTVEFNRESLEIMLEGLAKIRDQLSALS